VICKIYSFLTKIDLKTIDIVGTVIENINNKLIEKMFMKTVDKTQLKANLLELLQNVELRRRRDCSDQKGLNQWREFLPIEKVIQRRSYLRLCEARFGILKIELLRQLKNGRKYKNCS
jgi:hypothetical protein